MNIDSLISILNVMIKQESSQKELAKKLRISPQYLNDILRKRREPGDKILKPLKLRKVVTYEPR